MSISGTLITRDGVRSSSVPRSTVSRWAVHIASTLVAADSASAVEIDDQVATWPHKAAPSAVDPINKIFYWAYPGAGNLGGVPNRMLAYNWALDRWSLIELGGDVVAGRADQLDAALVCLTIWARADERRQERVMHVDDPRRVAIDEPRRQDLHVTREHDQLDVLLAQ